MKKLLLIFFTVASFVVNADSSTYGTPTMDTTGSANTGTDNGSSGSGLDTTPTDHTGTENETNSDLDAMDDPMKHPNDPINHPNQ